MSVANLQAPQVLPVGADETAASETTALQGGRATDALFAVADGWTPSLSASQPLARADLQHILTHTDTLWHEFAGKRFFITGGTGFFGIWLLETIAYANDQLGSKTSATILSRDPANFLARMPHLANRHEFEWLQGHPATFAFPDRHHDYLLHLATATSAHLGQTDPATMLKVKFASITRILDYARHAGIKRMLITSSGAVYGPQPTTLSHLPESYNGAPDPLNPASAYGNGKRLVEQVCALAPDVDTVIARCFSFIGPHLPLDARFAAGNFLRDALNDRPITLSGDGRPVRSYLHAADLLVWLLTILLRGKPRHAYNVGSDVDVTIRELAHLVTKTAHPMHQGQSEPMNHDQSLPPRYVPDIEVAGNELGLKVLIPLDEAIERTLRWHRS